MGVYQDIIGGKPIEKGWSGDRKYCATTADGSKYLLRLSPLEKHDRRKREFDKMCEVAALAIPMAQPVEFGVCAEGVYTIERFIEGVDAEEYIPGLPAENQYSYGLDAGRILAKLHTIPAPADAPAWGPASMQRSTATSPCTKLAR